VPGWVCELNVDLWSTSLVINKGHRFRVAVSSSNAPRFEANPNTGKPCRADQESRVAQHTLHLAKQHPSRIVLPVYAGPVPAGTRGVPVRGRKNCNGGRRLRPTAWRWPCSRSTSPVKRKGSRKSACQGQLTRTAEKTEGPTKFDR